VHIVKINDIQQQQILYDHGQHFNNVPCYVAS